MNPVIIGTVGAGYASHLHGRGYMNSAGNIPFRLKTICDTNTERAEKLQARFHYENITEDYNAMLADEEINVIDVVTPPYLHISMAIKALKAGKHVICEKPLTGYFGKRGEENIGLTTPRNVMYAQVLAEMEDLRKVLRETGKKFMYAENFVYAPPVQKAAEILRAKKSKILFMKGEESLKGSSSPVAGKWNRTGGGSLIRTGTHPLSGMLWRKHQEAQARGEQFGISSVSADTGTTTRSLTEYEHRHIEVYANDTAITCNITPTDILSTDFLECVALDKEPVSGFNIAYETVQVIYAAYLSAYEGRQVKLLD